MRLADALSATFGLATIDVFAAARDRIDPAWIHDALSGAEGTKVRSRKLPAEVVVWAVIGACLFAALSFPEVVRLLGLTAPTRRGTRQPAPHSSSVSEARARVAPEVIRDVFRTAATAWVAEPAVDRHRLQGLRVLVADGTGLLVPHTKENVEAFGLQKVAAGKAPPAYPEIRLVAVMDAASHIVIDAELAGPHDGEITLLEAIIPRIPDHSLLLLDRGFRSWGMLHRLATGGCERHWLIRGHDALKADTVQQLGPADRIVDLFPGLEARKRDDTLPKLLRAREIQFRIKNTDYRVLTSLLDARRFPAIELAKLYRTRWEIELAFDDLKTEQRTSNDVLRSRKPGGVKQEVWGLLLAHNLVRVEMARAAALVNLPPTRISFHGALRLVGHFLQFIPGATAPTKLAEREFFLRESLALLVLPPRRIGRTFPRAVKRTVSRFPKKRSAIAGEVAST